VQWVGIGLIGLGVLWESMLAPSVFGWGFILAGFLVVLGAGRRWPSPTPLDLPALLLVAMGGVSLLVTALPEVTRVQLARLGAGLAGFYGLVNWARDRVRLVWAGVGLVLGGVGLALLAPFIVDWSRGSKAILIPSVVYEPFPLLVSDAVHPNMMAALMLALFPLPLAWFLAGAGGRGVGERAALGLASLLMGVTLLLTRSRGGYIAAAVGGLAVMWLVGRRRWALALTLLSIGAGVWMFSAAEHQVPALVEEAVDTSTWAFRRRVWGAALWMLADFPFTGVGMGLFNQVASLLYAFQSPRDPGAHNVYLQVGVDLGILGLIAYVAVLILALWMALTAMRAFERKGNGELRAMAVGALSGMIALMVHGLVDVAAWGTRAAFFPWLLIGLIAALFTTATREEE
jgi:putative inorganic carbon (HCO3(-)) transporter